VFTAILPGQPNPFYIDSGAERDEPVGHIEGAYYIATVGVLPHGAGCAPTNDLHMMMDVSVRSEHQMRLFYSLQIPPKSKILLEIPPERVV
jgi:hypothetical protein